MSFQLPTSQKLGGFENALRLVTARFGLGPVNIVETGTIRVGADLHSDGGSTRYWKIWSENTGSQVWTVDIDEKNISACKSIIGAGAGINYVIEDSKSFLANFDKKIHLLFLDAMDCQPPIEDTWNHQLQEVKNAIPKLADGAIILIDDYNGIDRIVESKSMYSHPYLLENGFKIIYEGDHQIIFSKQGE